MLERINGILWSFPVLITILLCGIYFTVQSRFFQIRGIARITKTVFSSFKSSKNGISPFTAMATALGGTLGTGNIIGTATAISLGGAGAVFWMVLSAFFAMMTKYAEIFFAVLYRQKNSDNTYNSGPMYYMEKGLKSKPLAVWFALMGVLASFGMGNMTQANAIAESLKTGLLAPKIITSLGIFAVLSLCIVGSVKQVFKTCEMLIIPAGIIYVLGSIAVIFFYRENILSSIMRIFNEALNVRSFSGASIGLAMRYGISRGIFSNEAGLGSAPIAHGAADTQSGEKQGMMGIFEVFADTILMCFLTALMILCCGADKAPVSCADMAAVSFSSVFGGFGLVFVSLSVAVFGITSIISWSVYGSACFKYLFGEKFVRHYKRIFCFGGLFGGMMALNTVWEIADTLNWLMLVPNIITIVWLSRKHPLDLR